MDDFNQALIRDYRANGKPTFAPFQGRQLLLLTTTGAKSGVERTSPLAYSRDGDRYVVVASKGGAPSHPAWYRNLVQRPAVTLEVGTERFAATATPAEPEAERRRLYDQHAALNPVFKDYEKKTTRRIPVVVLERSGI